MAEGVAQLPVVEMVCGAFPLFRGWLMADMTCPGDSNCERKVTSRTPPGVISIMQEEPDEYCALSHTYNYHNSSTSWLSTQSPALFLVSCAHLPQMAPAARTVNSLTLGVRHVSKRLVASYFVDWLLIAWVLILESLLASTN